MRLCECAGVRRRYWDLGGRRPPQPDLLRPRGGGASGVPRPRRGVSGGGPRVVPARSRPPRGCREGGDVVSEPKLTPKERTKIPRQPMPEQPAEERRHNFAEVNKGLTVLGAPPEAMRCLECAKPHCQTGCPVNVNIHEFVRLCGAGDFLAAAAKIREDNVLPAITGRVCPQETQCEGCCILGHKFEPLGIGYLERFVADYEREHGQCGLAPRPAPTRNK